MSPKSNFPPLTSHIQSRGENLQGTQPMQVYSCSNELNKTNCSRFFTLKPNHLSQSPNTDITTCRSALTSHDMYSSPKPLLSDISERIESFELRSKKGNGIEVFAYNFSILQKCFEEVLPLLNKNEPEIKEGLVKFCKHFEFLTRDVIKLHRRASKESSEKLERVSKDLALSEIRNKKLSQDLEKIQEYKKVEMEKIEREIEELFGKNDLEILGLRRILKDHQENYSQDTVDCLLQICRSMDQEHEIPDMKNSDFLGMDPSEVPELMWKNFSFVQRFTARRISDILKLKKITANHETQTYVDYIPPAALEEQVKHAEKLQIQLNSAYVSIQKYRESFGSKVNVLESLESEKSNLLDEVSKLRKEVEALSNSIEKSHYELKKVSTELDSAKRERETLTKEKNQLHSAVIEKEKVIEEFKGTVEKIEKSVKDKEEKIQGLEKSLAKRAKRKEAAKEEQPAAGSNQKKNSKFDEKEFLASMKSNKRASKDSPLAPGSFAANSSNPVNFDDTGSSNSRLSTQGGPSSAISSASSSKSKVKTERAQSPNKRGLNVKLNQIDEVPSPTGRSGRRNDERHPEISISSPAKKSRDKSRDKSRATGTYSQESDEDNHSRAGHRRRKSRQGSGSDDYENDYSVESGENSSEGISGGTQVYVKRPQKNSRHSQISDVSRGSKRSKGSKGSEFYERRTTVSSKCTSMDDLIWENSIKFSKAVQMNGLGVPDDLEAPDDGVYLFPYNPNQFYALRGDKFYHSGQAVFSAQPRIPDLKNSVTFASPYQLSPRD